MLYQCMLNFNSLNIRRNCKLFLVKGFDAVNTRVFSLKYFAAYCDYTYQCIAGVFCEVSICADAVGLQILTIQTLASCD